MLLANVSANVILSSGYDAEGHRVSLSANIGGTLAGNGTVTGGIKDFINTYTFNTRGDMTGITQTAQTGGSDNGVAAKNVVLGYNNNGQIGSIAAYASTGTGSQVYSATDSYNANLRFTDLVYSAAGSTLAGYHLDYNSNSTVADEYVRNDTTGTPGASYTSWAELTNTVDHDSQLLSTSYSSNFANPPAAAAAAAAARRATMPTATAPALGAVLSHQRHRRGQPHALRRHLHLCLRCRRQSHPEMGEQQRRGRVVAAAGRHRHHALHL